MNLAYLTFLVTILAFAVCNNAMAESEFGQPFAKQAHNAFEDPSDDFMNNFDPAELQNIEPAAGGPDIHNTDDITNAEQELEAKFDTEVTRTIQQGPSGEIETRDRVGDGPVGIFYDHGKNDRMSAEEDTIGIDMKLLEFN